MKLNLKKVLKISLYLLIILTIYSAGVMFGSVNGVQIALEYNNETLCDLFIKAGSNFTIENNECIMKENAKYNNQINCNGEIFKIKGERDKYVYENILHFPRKVLFFSFTGCF